MPDERTSNECPQPRLRSAAARAFDDAASRRLQSRWRLPGKSAVPAPPEQAVVDDPASGPRRHGAGEWWRRRFGPGGRGR